MAFIDDKNELLISQYKGQPNINKILDIFCGQLEEIKNAYIQLLNNRHIDVADGVQLDIIGEILGYARPYILTAPDDIFTLENNANLGKGFGTYTNALTGGRFVGFRNLDGFSFLDDVNYRKRLKGKIIKNHSKGTIDDVLNYIYAIFEQMPTITIDVGFVDLEFIIFIPPEDVQFLRETIPLPVGINLRNVVIP